MKTRGVFGAAGLEVAQPGLERRLSEASIAAKPNMGNAAGARLRPDPVGPHPESLGDLLGGQQPVHMAELVDAFT